MELLKWVVEMAHLFSQVVPGFVQRRRCGEMHPHPDMDANWSAQAPVQTLHVNGLLALVNVLQTIILNLLSRIIPMTCLSNMWLVSSFSKSYDYLGYVVTVNVPP